MYRFNEKKLIDQFFSNQGDIQQNILQDLIKINISNIQQTHYPLKTIIDKLL